MITAGRASMSLTLSWSFFRFLKPTLPHNISNIFCKPSPWLIALGLTLVIAFLVSEVCALLLFANRHSTPLRLRTPPISGEASGGSRRQAYILPTLAASITRFVERRQSRFDSPVPPRSLHSPPIQSGQVIRAVSMQHTLSFAFGPR